MVSILLFFWGLYLSVFLLSDFLDTKIYSKEGKTVEMIVVRKYIDNVKLVAYNADSTINNEQRIYVNDILKAKLKLFQKVSVVEMINDKNNEVKYYIKMSFEDENIALLERPWTVRIVFLIAIFLPFLIKIFVQGVPKQEEKKIPKENSEDSKTT